jgi:uncharacterized RDD family membrane protein YckC
VYQILGADGVPGEAVDLAVLKEMAADGRLEPSTVVLDPVSGRSMPAGEMFVGDELFPVADPAAEPSAPVAAAQEPVAGVAPPPPAPIATVPDVSQTPAAPPVTATPFSLPISTYPSVAADLVPDLGARFIGLLIDSLIGFPLLALSIIPLVGIVMAPITVAYWLSRDAFFGGQSVGKRVGKTRVVRLDGSPFTWQHSALRNITYLPILALVIPVFGVVLGYGLLGPCTLADVICVLITQRRIGDFLANTQVVRAE